MKKLILVFVSAITGSVLTILLLGTPPTVRAGGGAPTCTSQNGDVNADGKLDLTDAVTILGHLFRGSPTELVPLCATPAAPSRGLPDTGQTKCHEEEGAEIPCGSADCPGQDGSQATGCPNDANRFVVNDNETPADTSDDTVTDTCTGLMWEKVNENRGRALSWCIALAYCDALNLAGHNDWRLPNVRELQSIVDYGRSHPAIAPIFGASPPQAKGVDPPTESWYWSSTSYADAVDGAWCVDFDLGHGGVFEKGEISRVRAVRSMP